MAKLVEDRGRGARMARRDEGAYSQYVTEEQRSQPGWIGREIDRLSRSRALRKQRQFGQAERVGPALRHVEGLDGLSAGAAGQVVDGAHSEHQAGMLIEHVGD